MPLCFSDSEVTLSLKTKTLISDILSDFMAEAQIKKEVKRDEDKQTKKKKPHQHLTELKKWQFVFKPEHNTYVKKLLKSKEFSLWVWQDLELLFAAIHSRNPEMVQFLSKKKGAIKRFIERYKYPPLFLAMIAQNVKVIEIFLNHPDTDLSIRDFSDNNMFHYIFLGIGQSGQ